MKTNQYDVIIIGAGVAGLSAAQELDNSGLNVLLLEKNKSLSKGPLNLKATFHNTTKKFKIEDSIIRKYTTTGFIGPKVKTVVDMKSEPAVLINLFAALKTIRKRIKNVKFKFNTEVIDVKINKKHVEVISWDNKRYTAKVAIVASGNNTSFSEEIGIKREKAYYNFYGFELSNCNIDPSEAIFINDKDYSECGFWIYPISRNRCQIVNTEVEPLIEVTKTCLRTSLLRLIRESKKLGLEKAKIIPKTELYVKYPIDPIEEITKDRVIFVGDAAGQATPIMGEGIRPSLEMGVEAAKTVKKAFDKKDFSNKILDKYEKKWWNAYGKYFFYGVIMRHYITLYFKNKDYDETLTKFNNASTEEQYRFIKSKFETKLIKKLISYNAMQDVVFNMVKKSIDDMSITSRRKFISNFA